LTPTLKIFININEITSESSLQIFKTRLDAYLCSLL